MIVTVPDLRDLFLIHEAPRHLPKRHGRLVHLSTIYRWVTVGSRGVKLQTWLVGGARYTSSEALRQFVENLTAARDGRVPTPVAAAAARQADVSQQLDRLGI